MYEIKKLNIKNTILGSMDKIIDAFTEYYGEEHRDLIKERFTNLYIAPFIDDEVFSKLMYAIKKEVDNYNFSESTKNFILNYKWDGIKRPISETPMYKNVLKEIESFGFISDDYEYDDDNIAHVLGTINPNAIEKDGRLLLYPIFLITIKSKFNDEYFDDLIIHELNHLYEFSIGDIDSLGIIYLSGWESYRKPNSLKDKVYEEQGKYQIFNEIINELIAQDITAIMHSHENYILSDKEHSKIKGGCIYEIIRFLVEDFFIKYKEDIKLSRKNGNISIIKNRVGADNFDALNDLIRKFCTEYEKPLFNKAINDYKEGDMTKERMWIQAILDKRDDILSKMEEYSAIFKEKNKNI